MPKISICIPVYNTAKFIERCFESILNQNFEDIEIIVVNDASPDNALEIIKKYSLTDSRFNVISKTSNEGLMCARKDAYTRAKGDYVMFVDSDDYLEQNALSILYNKIISENAEIVVSGYNYHTVDNKTTSVVYSLPFGNDRGNTIKALLEGYLPHNLWGNIYNRNLFENKNYTCLKNQTNGEDMLLFYELVANSTKIVAVNQPLYAYCQNLLSATQIRFTNSKLIQLIEVNKIWFKYMCRLNLFNNLVEKRFILSIYNKLMAGYPSKIIREATNDMHDILTFNHLQTSIGLFKTIAFLFFYYMPIPYRITRILKRIHHRNFK